MKVMVGAMFRDSSKYLARTLHQYDLLAKEMDANGASVRFALVENDSIDDTRARLEEWLADKPDSHLVLRSDDCPYFGSQDRPDRWRHLAWVANGVLEQVEPDDDAVVYCESDLAWETETILRLIEHLDAVDVVSPLNMREDGPYFDLWGSRGMDGRRFTMGAPHHPDLAHADGLVQVQSLAGCTAMVADVARMTRFAPEDCYVGWNRAMRLSGWSVWCDPSLKVVHPWPPVAA